MDARYEAPTPEQIEAIEREAHALRARALAAGVRAIAASVSARFQRSSNGAHA